MNNHLTPPPHPPTHVRLIRRPPVFHLTDQDAYHPVCTHTPTPPPPTTLTIPLQIFPQVPTVIHLGHLFLTKHLIIKHLQTIVSP